MFVILNVGEKSNSFDNFRFFVALLLRMTLPDVIARSGKRLGVDDFLGGANARATILAESKNSNPF